MQNSKLPRVCACEVCKESGNEVVDEITGAIVRGRLLIYDEFLEHRRAARAKAEDAASTMKPSIPAHHGAPEARQPEAIPLRPQGLPEQASVPELPHSQPSLDSMPLPYSDHHQSGSLAKDWEVIEKVITQLPWRSEDVPTPLKRLVFQYPPQPDNADVPMETVLQIQVNSGAFPLKYDREANMALLRYQSWLVEMHGVVTGIALSHADAALAARRAYVQNTIVDELVRLEELKKQEWRRQRQQLDSAYHHFNRGVTVLRTDAYFTTSEIERNVVLFACYLLAAFLHVICRLSVDHIQFVLTWLEIILKVAARSSSSPTDSTIPNRLTRRIDYVSDSLRIESVFRSVICCSRCFACYEMEEHPDFCTDTGAPGGQACGNALVRARRLKGQTFKDWRRTFHYREVKDWIAQLLSRPGMEKELDRDVYDTGAGAGQAKDIWDGRVLKEFLGPDGHHFIHARGPAESRLVFSLCMDGFNPFFNKHGGKVYSSGAIYLVILNLPVHLRYRPENICLFCVFPGPKEPSETQINHILKFMVDDFLLLWDPGIYFTETCAHPAGRLVRGALVPLICDLKAMHQMSAIGHWCAKCRLPANDIENLDEALWPAAPDCARHREIALEWRDADLETRIKIFNAHHIRWTELLRLPYWDPCRHVVIDVMHNILGGILEHHCRTLWRLEPNLDDGLGEDEEVKPKLRVVTPAAADYAWKILHHGKDKELKALSAYILRHLCKEIGIPQGGRHVLLLKRLRDWRVSQKLVDDSGNPVKPLHQPGRYDPATVEEITRLNLTLGDTTSLTRILQFRVKVIEHVLLELLAQQNAPTLSELSTLTAEEITAITSSRSQSTSLRTGLIEDNSNVTQSQLSPSLLPKFGVKSKDELAALLIKVYDKAPKEIRKNTAVLGRDTLGRIRQLISRTSLPSWIGRVPEDLGSSRHGTLSADEWRTTVTVSLPIALIPMWSDTPPDSRQREMLKNFLDLVNVANIATSRVLTASSIAEFHSTLLSYLKGALKLYHHHGFKYNQHVCLHLAKVMEDFGPTHGWRCFVFERLNFMLQNTKTNQKTGEMELTMLKRFNMNQNIRSMLLENLPEPLEEMRDAFNRTFDSDRRGTLLSEWHDERIVTFQNLTKLTRLDPSLCELLRAHGLSSSGQVLLQRSFRRGGVRFAAAKETDEDGPADSHVVTGKLSQNAWYVIRITDIIVVPSRGHLQSDRIFVVGRRFIPLEDSEKDPYLKQKQGYRMGRLFYALPTSKKVLVDVEDIICHCAMTLMEVAHVEGEVVHALPLNRGEY